VARRVLVLGAAVWILLGAGGLLLAAVGTDNLLARLPPLAIDADALGGAITAVGFALAATGVTHVVVLIGLRRGRRWASSAGALLASVLAIVSLALAATAFSSAVRESAYALPLVGAGSLATLAAAAYGIAAVRLAHELGSGSAD
jgi:uncharacterized membrane protein